MFKTLITAAVLSLTAASAHAALPADAFGGPTLSDQTALITETQDAYDTAYYCEWVTVYDYWGNWVTVWQCY